MKVRLVALDIDGTLLDGRGMLRPAVREAVRQTVERGLLVTLATGRRFDTASEVASELGLELPLVLHGGTIIQDSLTGEVMYEDAMQEELLRDVIAEVAREGHQPVLYRSPAAHNELLAGPPEDDSNASRDYLTRQHRYVRRLDHGGLARADHVVSLAVFHYEDVLRPLHDRLDEWPSCKVLLWEPEPMYETAAYLLDVVNPGCSKAKALAHLAASYGIGMEEVMAIGDQINDLELLESVGLGIAMGNAIPSVRARANAVVGTNDEDGVVEALHRYVLDDERPCSGGVDGLRT